MHQVPETKILLVEIVRWGASERASAMEQKA
jgi:hypothetical protein